MSDSRKAQTPSILPTSSSSSPQRNVRYFRNRPFAAVDIASCADSNQGPWDKLGMNVLVLLKITPFLFNIFLPLSRLSVKGAGETPPPPSKFQSIGSVVALAVVSVLGTVFLLLTPITVGVLPGFVSLALGILVLLIGFLFLYPFEGPKIAYSQFKDQKATPVEQWLYVNGVLGTGLSLQRDIDQISATFGRPVIGIHNATKGLAYDIVECLVQRVFDLDTQDVRMAYAYIRASLEQKCMKKVVLIAHSQGGIIVSIVLDRLFGELPPEVLAKLEIYTFGSAAAHFRNPPRKPLYVAPGLSPNSVSTLLTQAGIKRVVPYVEHYANQHDPISQWGVLYSLSNVLTNSFSGHAFVRLGWTGHLFRQFYLDAIFPSTDHAKCPYLNEVVIPDTESEKSASNAVQRALENKTAGLFDSQLVQWGDGTVQSLANIIARNAQMDASTGGGTGDEASTQSGVDLVDPNETDKVGGMTVRDVSRLWMYLGGRSPKSAPDTN